MTDNRTTGLREMLDRLIRELDMLDIALDAPASNMTLGEYEQAREKLLDGFMQAIAATLGSGTCKNKVIEINAHTPLEFRTDNFLCSECNELFLADSEHINHPIDWAFCPNCGRRVER